MLSRILLHSSLQVSLHIACCSARCAMLMQRIGSKFWLARIAEQKGTEANLCSAGPVAGAQAIPVSLRQPQLRHHLRSMQRCAVGMGSISAALSLQHTGHLGASSHQASGWLHLLHAINPQCARKPPFC